MAHFAQLDENNIVVRVLVVNNSNIIDELGNENEQKGVMFLKNLFGDDTIWKQTSYNGNFRKNYAGIGYTYNEEIDAFVPPRPFLSWLLDNNTAQWQSPVPMPQDGKKYIWDENALSWIETI